MQSSESVSVGSEFWPSCFHLLSRFPLAAARACTLSPLNPSLIPPQGLAHAIPLPGTLFPPSSLAPSPFPAQLPTHNRVSSSPVGSHFPLPASVAVFWDLSVKVPELD